jgi:hypothetical protein
MGTQKNGNWIPFLIKMGVGSSMWFIEFPADNTVVGKNI